MTTISPEDLDSLKSELVEERERLTEELAARGKPLEHGDWEGASETTNTADMADPNDVGDQIEELVTNVPLVEDLQSRLENVNAALEKMQSGTYGTCEVGGEEIPIERLHANPAAKTCIEHAPTERPAGETE